MDIYLVRHGQASAGSKNYDRLSPLGIKQAELLGDYWQKSGLRVDAAFCGSLERQQHTAELVLNAQENDIALSTIEALNEYDHVAVDHHFGQGNSNNDGLDLSFSQYCSVMQRWHDDNNKVDKGKDNNSDQQHHLESWESFNKRGWNGIQSAIANHSSDAKLAFFTSGGVIATILQNVMGLAFMPTMHAIWRTRNSSITQLHFDGAAEHPFEQHCVVSFNGVPHLEIHADDTLITQI